MTDRNAIPSAFSASRSRFDAVDLAQDLLDGYEVRTGVAEGSDPADTNRRYLWTDALAVSAEVRLAERRPELDRDRSIDRIIECVHATLGRHRGEDGRQGPLSGDDARPTAGGLRIGKTRPERRVDEPFDETLEWERDGQYFHYLTKWIHALLDVSERRGDEVALRWARDLAETACEAFIERGDGSRPVARGAMSLSISSTIVPTISWKRSIDLRRVLVPGGGTLDPLDGLATVTRVATACARRGLDVGSLGSHIDELASICTSASGWATADPLGIGGVIGSGLRILDALAEPAAMEDRALMADLVDFALLDARAGLEVYERSRRGVIGHRPGLGFRELGLSEGLHRARRHRNRFESTASSIRDAPRRESISRSLEELSRFESLGIWIERHWIEASRRGLSEWQDRLDINEISLASSLLQRAR